MFNRAPRLELDFRASRRQARWPGALLLALSLALAAGLVSRHRDAQLELARLEAEVALAGADRGAAVVSRAGNDEELRNAQAVARQLALPWAPLVQTIERAATRDVALLELQPDPQAGVVRLTAEARHREAMFEYARRLGMRGLRDVHLVGHELQREDPRRPIRFSAQASLR